MRIEIKNIDEKLLENIFEALIELKNYNSSLHFESKNIDAFNRKKTKKLFEYIPADKAYLIGAFDDKELVGFVWGYPRNFFDEERIFINSLVVNKKYEKNGIGRKLIEKISNLAKQELNYKVLDLTVDPSNVNALEFYKHLGFKSERIQMRLEI